MSPARFEEDTVFQVELSGDGRVQAVYAMRNPGKLVRLQQRG